MHMAAGTLCLILLAASYQMLSDVQRMVHGMYVQSCDDGHHTAHHDYNNYW